MCRHPHQNIRVESDRNTLSCPDCGVSVAGTTGTALTLEPCSVPVAPASDYSTGRYGQRYCHHPRGVFVQDQTGYRLSCPDCPVPTVHRTYGPTRGTLRLPVWDRMMNRAADGFPPSCVVTVPPESEQHPSACPQDGSGLGASGRGVPDHRPGSWLSGRPWDDRPSPERDVLPVRKPDTTPEQRLRAAADRIRDGFM
jgi:ribosomal protein L37AE/L43A